MKKDLARRFALVLAAMLPLAACGGPSGTAAPAQAPTTLADDAVTSESDAITSDAITSDAITSDVGTSDAVRAGRYRLRLTMSCRSRLETATGVLSLRPMSGSVGPSDASPGSTEAALLWGQTNLDLDRFSTCLGRTTSASGEPIHPSVLVEVLHWDGASHQQVLLVSLESARSSGGSSPVGVAMWVERVEHGHLAGVWSRWELIGRGEGRWEADLLP